MKRVLIACVALLVCAPLALSVITKYYLKKQSIPNIGTDIDIKQLDFEHGWFQSNSIINLVVKQQNLIINSINTIDHGPIIWPLLIRNPLEAFSLFRIDTEFKLLSQFENLSQTDHSGTASTLISYLGDINTKITHPGMNILALQTQLFTDLPKFNSQIKSDGTILGSLNANQIELTNKTQNLYLIKPEIDFTKNPDWSFPEYVSLDLPQITGANYNDRYESKNFILTSRVQQQDELFNLNTKLFADQFVINKALAESLSMNLRVNNLDQASIDYISINHQLISAALTSNQWLVILKHISQLLKLIGENQLNIALSINGLHDNQTIELNFSGHLTTSESADLNPFSLLEHLKMNLLAMLPVKFIAQINRPDVTEFFQMLIENGLLIKKQHSYYSNLSFENSKLKVNHKLP